MLFLAHAGIEEGDMRAIGTEITNVRRRNGVVYGVFTLSIGTAKKTFRFRVAGYGTPFVCVTLFGHHKFQLTLQQRPTADAEVLLFIIFIKAFSAYYDTLHLIAGSPLVSRKLNSEFLLL
jgi:hypothetical protein